MTDYFRFLLKCGFTLAFFVWFLGLSGLSGLLDLRSGLSFILGGVSFILGCPILGTSGSRKIPDSPGSPWFLWSCCTFCLIFVWLDRSLACYSLFGFFFSGGVFTSHSSLACIIWLVHPRLSRIIAAASLSFLEVSLSFLDALCFLSSFLTEVERFCQVQGCLVRYFLVTHSRKMFPPQYSIYPVFFRAG